MKKTILIIDDEKDIIEFISYNLINHGFNVISAFNGKDGLNKAILENPDLILLDIMMPEMDGYETCSEIRKIKALDNTVVVFLSAKNEDVSQIQGFDAGANDFIVKTIKTKLLVKKIFGLLKLTENLIDNEAEKDASDDLLIDYDSLTITIEGKKFNLTKKEFNLISLLYSNTKKVFRREEILDKIWGNDVVVGDRTIDVHIRKLREKLGNNKIITIKGVGYKYCI
ncbi:MAG: response regulator transcription factor [Solirubrobacteraceae bacterium]